MFHDMDKTLNNLFTDETAAAIPAEESVSEQKEMTADSMHGDTILAPCCGRS